MVHVSRIRSIVHAPPRPLALFALLAVVGLGLAITLPLHAQSNAQSDDQARGTFEGETSVVLVEVPVTVVRDGQPVRGLTKENFQVFEGRRQREIVGFDVLDLAQVGPAEARQMPAAARRHFLLLFDLSLSQPASIVKARAAAQDLVISGLHPTDLVAVATYTLSQGPQLVLGFTSDRRQIDLAIATLGVPQLAQLQAAPDPLGLVYAETQGSVLEQTAGNEAQIGPGAALSGMADEQVEEVVRRSQAQDTQDQTNKIIGMSRAMADLGKVLDSVEGRKHVVWLSEGFDNSLLFGSQDAQVQEEQAIAAMRGDYSSVDSNTRFGNSRLQGDIDNMLDAFKKSDATIQAVDIGGLRSNVSVGQVRATSDQGMFYFANETGGEFYQNFNDLGAAMGQMLERNSVTYLLSFRPGDRVEEGEYQRLRVELEGVPRGTRAVHRPGYTARTAYADQSPVERRFRTADALLSGEPGGDFGAQVIAVPFDAPGDHYVPVLVEIDGPSFFAGAPSGVVGAEIYAYALDGNGGVTDFFNQNVGIDTAQLGGAPRGGLKYFGHLDLPPGEYQLRVFVRNQVTGAGALTVSDLAVPDDRSAGPVILPALFPETSERAERWVVTRETEADQRAGVGFPFMLREGPYLPTAMPVLRSGQAAPVALVAYNMDPSAMELQVQVERPDGTVIEGGNLQVSDRFRLEGEDSDRLVGSFDPSGLAPGDYRLRITVLDPDTGESHTSRSPFRVAG